MDTELARLATVVVDARVLRRVIKTHRKIRGAGLLVPHEHQYVIERVALEPLLEKGELAVELASLPERVIVVAGDRDTLATPTPEGMTKLWRGIFHGRIHHVLEGKLAASELTLPAIRERVNRIGQTEFDEIRSVLRQEDLLLPPVDEIANYIEFVALYLELRHFAPEALGRTFPALLDAARVDATIALDLDALALLAASRPPAAPEQPLLPVVRAVTEVPRLAFADPSARKSSAAARKKGNLVRAAILAARAGDVPDARADLELLCTRLAEAVGGGATTGWADGLLPVAIFAASERSLRFSPGARLLLDLQAACLISQRETKVVDVVGWALALGKQPVVRSLPSTREVRVAKRLHAALAKISAAGVGEGADRARLSHVLHAMVERADDHVRAVSRPKIEAALDAVGLHPHSLPERVGEKKAVDELLDRAVAVGRLSLPNLRDSISQNDLKLPDLSVEELAKGDQLLRADKILAGSLDGVYRRGEAYLRFVQKISSLLFGTGSGRFLTLYALLPLLGSFAVLEGLQHMIGPLAKKLFQVEVEIATRDSLLVGAGILFLLMHLPFVRRGAWYVTRLVGRALRFVLWRIPQMIWRASPQLRWFAKPALPAALTLLVIHSLWRWPIAGAVFVVAAAITTSRWGRVLEEYAGDWAVRSGRQLTGKILPGAVKYILQLFSKLMELLDRAIYRVDEWLRFRAGESRALLVIKGGLGVIWFVITYVLRLYVNLFVEPTINPIKHFPVVTVAAKIMIPFIPAILSGVSGPASSVLGPTLGAGFAGFTILVLPGLAGFLVWELKENWKLYRKTRPKLLAPLSIGHHGESMVGFMKPGFHSGTIPKLYTKLRRAAWHDDERGVAKHREGLHHVEDAVHKFVDRELVSMLNEVGAFQATDVALHHVTLGSNRVQIAVACPSIGREPATIRFEQQSGWLVANLPEPGWIARLSPDQRRIFEIALAGFYKLCGVDIVREQLEHVLRGSAETAPAYDVADEGIVVWPGKRYDTEVVYDLRSRRALPTLRGEPYQGAMPDLLAGHAVFAREKLYWSVWTTAWQEIARGDSPTPLMVGPSLIPAVTAREPAAPAPVPAAPLAPAG